MAITRDGTNSPAGVNMTSNGTNSVGTTAAFNVAAGQWIYANAYVDTDGLTRVWTPTNTGNVLTWTKVAQNDAVAGGSVATYRALNASTQTGITVTLTVDNGGTSGQWEGTMWVDLWSGAAATQTGAATNSGISTSTNFNATLTTTVTGSQVVGLAVDDSQLNTPTSTDTFNSTLAGHADGIRAYKAAVSGAPGSVNVNFQATTTPAWGWITYEILTNSNVSVNLTGQTITSSEGTLARAASYSSTGQTATFSEGTITASTNSNVTKSLTGQSITSSQGTLTYNVQYSLNDGVALTGQTATLTEGTPTGSITYTLTGQSITSSEGTISANAGSNVTKTLTGQTITSANGTLISSVQTSSLTAQTATFSEGTLVQVTTYGATGQTATFTEGTITPATSGNVTLTLGSLTATFTEGQMTQSGGTPVLSPYLPFVGFIWNIGTLKGR